MNCLYPLKIFLPGGKYTYVPCGKCISCRINRRREWTQRLLHESYKYPNNTFFVTLTYKDEFLPYDENGVNCVCKEDIQKFFKRLRKRYPENKIRYFVGAEYGPQTFRPHYHGIIYNLPLDVLGPSSDFISGMVLYDRVNNLYQNTILNDIWQKGFTTISQVNRQRCSYCAKYFIERKEIPEFLTPIFNLMSKRPGIGSDYAEAISEKVKYYGLNSCLTDNGKYITLPRYYRKKIYGDFANPDFYTNLDQINENLENQFASYDSEVQKESIYKSIKLTNPKSKL